MKSKPRDLTCVYNDKSGWRANDISELRTFNSHLNKYSSLILRQFIPFCTHCIKQINHCVVLLISILYWLKSDYDVEYSCFPLNFLFWRHEKRRPCPIRSHEKNTYFCRSVAKKQYVSLRIVWKSLENRFYHHISCTTICIHSRPLHFKYLKRSASLAF